MGERTAISWTDHTYNHWRGCERDSPGCDHCYAELLSKRNPSALGRWGGDDVGVRVYASAAYRKGPEHWNDRARERGVPETVFALSLGDVFEATKIRPTTPKGELLLCCDVCGRIHVDDHESLSRSCECGRFLQRVEWASLDDVRRDFLQRTVDATPCLIWLLLTKRPQHVRAMTPPRRVDDETEEPEVSLRENAWLGFSAENQEQFDRRFAPARDLLDLYAGIFVSVEPMLGPVDVGPALAAIPRERLWIICGGESGPHARPMHPDWPRRLRDQTVAAGVPFHFKQWGEFCPKEDVFAKHGDELWSTREHLPRTVPTRLVGEGDERLQMVRVGTKAAGQLLDREEWLQFPASFGKEASV